MSGTVPPQLVDIGVNLGHKSFQNDRDALLRRARVAGVHHILVTGTSETGSRRAVELADQLPDQLSATAGVHPHDASSATESTVQNLADLATSDRVVAIGECGLDYNRDFSPRDAQRRWFEAQLELAVSCKLPVFLHERDAHEDFARILGAHRPKLVGAVVHCFTGDARALSTYLDLDCDIGITGWVCDERRGEPLRKLIPRIPLDRLMIETDAPFLIPRVAPLKKAGRRNEPAFLPHVLDAIAALRPEDRSAIAKATTDNACRRFGLSLSSC